jgi:hypothetical protein
LVCAKHVAQSNSRSVNQLHLLDLQRFRAAAKQKAARCKAGGFFVKKFGVRALFRMLKKCSDPDFFSTLLKLHPQPLGTYLLSKERT